MLLQPTEADFFDDFDHPELDLSKWIPVYLPQWASTEATKPRYRIEDSQLILTIKPDQLPWSPEFNGPVRVSNVQTGVWSGSLGSQRGQHLFSPSLRVRQEQLPRQTYTPLYGRIQFRCLCRIRRSNVAALWMIGLEDEPQRSAEICLFELKGTNIEPHSAIVGYGVRAFADPALKNDFFEDRFSIEVEDWHTWGIEWTQRAVRFFLDDMLIRTLLQSPNYPMQLMLNLYDLEPPSAESRPLPEFRIDWVRGSIL